MSVLDHLLALLLIVVVPVSGYVSYTRLVRRARAGYTPDVTRLYTGTMIWQWLLFIVALFVWAYADRSWAALGFGTEIDTNMLIGALLAAAAIVFVVVQIRGLSRAMSADAATCSEQLGDVALLMPKTDRELAHFYGLSLTAGVVEETLWRGYIIWYFGQFMPIWAAAVLSAIGFGIAHAYQGARSVPRVTVVGGVFAGLFLLTGSLWIPIVLHAVFDMVQGRAVFRALRASPG